MVKQTPLGNPHGARQERPEPAAATHRPDGWLMREIAFEPSGKAPKALGADVFRFGGGALNAILPRRGWTLVKQTRTYAFLSPPSGAEGPPFSLSIAVPPDEEVLAIARRSHAAGKSWISQLGEWPASYLHERDRSMQRMWRDPATGTMQVEKLQEPPQSDLYIGEYGLWIGRATASGGDFVLGGLQRPLLEKIARLADDPLPAPSPLWEGGAKVVEQTTHERNPEARRRCLAHFGPACKACGLNYEERYGPIGAGLIHVHHTTPIASIGERYEIDPVRDLVPLCATCHHVVHSRTPAYTVEEVRSALGGGRLS